MIAWFARNGVAANLLAIILTVGGLLVATAIKLELFPKFELEVVLVAVPYPGAAPEDVEDGICLRIEEEIQDLEGIKKLTSTAEEGLGTVVAEVERGVSVQNLLDRIKVRIDAIDNFPDEAEEPIVEQPEIQRDTITIAIHGELTERSLKSIAERVRDEVTLLPGVSSASVKGVRDYEISVEVDEARLREFGLTFNDVADELRSASLDLPGGTIQAEQGQILLRANTLAKDSESIGDIVLLSDPSGAIIRVRDVATVVDGFTVDPLITRFDGSPAAMVRIFEVGNQNPLNISRQIENYVAEEKLRLPEGVSIDVWRDFSVYLRDRLDLLITNGVVGFLLVLGVLTLFLRPSLALFVSIGIPISFLATILVMPVLGQTINLVTLFGFILVLGIVVDDAIIVGESVFSEFQKNGAGVESAIRGTHLVAVPVTFAVLTTVVAFCPIFFIPGVFGKLFFGIPAVVIPALLFSLVQSKLVLPYHLSLCNVGNRDREKIGKVRRLQLAVADGLENFVQNIYRPLLAVAMRWRYLTASIFIATLILIIGLVGGGIVRFIFLAPVPSDYILALMNMPEGSPYSMTEANMKRLSNALDEVREDLQEQGLRDPIRYLSISLGGSQFQEAGPGGSTSESSIEQGEIALELVPPEVRDVSAPELADLWREKVGYLPGVRDLTFFAEAANPAGTAIDIQLTGPSFDDLERVAGRIQNQLATYVGIFDIRNSYAVSKDEINLKILPSARTSGLTQTDIARQVRGAFFGDEVQRIQRGRDEIKIMVRYPEKERGELATLENMWVRNAQGDPMPLRNAADLEMGEGFSEIRRVNRQRAVNIFADADDATASVNDVLKDLQETIFPDLQREFPSVNITFEGERREQADIFANMGKGAVLAALVIYALLAIPFRSYSQPLIVMSVIPFGIVGAIAGHLLTGQDFSILSILGLVALSGVVVNDSLVLVDYINKQVRSGEPLLDAVRNSGARRFRPVLLTSLTTFVGLVPILLETNLQAQFLIPMATSLAFGILYATFITLFLVPAVYLILEDIKNLFRSNTSG
ncbi:MAG: efflux RND transporter permease subunit [Verrucomicrobiota bacterium]